MHEIYVKGGTVKRWSKLATISGKSGQYIFKDEAEANKVIDDRLKTNSWLKRENFQIRPYKLDLRMHGKSRFVKY